VLDPALLRPGRFDRQVVVPLPDVRGREQILKVHMRKIPAAEDVKASILARGTPGFSGADLANLVNEAALFAARSNKKMVDMDDMEKAKDKIMMGAERRSMVMSDDEKRLTAYHESGHAIVGRLVPDHDPVHKVSIIPRGRALGVTLFLPEDDRFSYSKQRLESSISSLFGGRLAEELIFGAESVTTGAQNDIHRATEIARNMVTKWGLSDKLGPLTYSEEEQEVFLGHSVTQHKSVSDETTHLIDEEIRSVIERNYERARGLLVANMDKLHAMSAALMKYETIDAEQIDDIMSGRPPRPPSDWDDEETGGVPVGRTPPSRGRARTRGHWDGPQANTDCKRITDKGGRDVDTSLFRNGRNPRTCRGGHDHPRLRPEARLGGRACLQPREWRQGPHRQGHAHLRLYVRIGLGGGFGCSRRRYPALGSHDDPRCRLSDANLSCLGGYRDHGVPQPLSG
jgi:cell division protease FtsH